MDLLAYRPADESDARSLSGLAQRALRPHTLPGWTSSAVERLLRENSEQALRDYLEDATFAYVCVEAASRVGFITSKVPGLLSLLVVDPSRQRRGIGSHLVNLMLEHVAEVAPELGVVEVNATEYSLPFYQRLGFFPISDFIEFEGCRFARLAVWRKNPLLRR